MMDMVTRSAIDTHCQMDGIECTVVATAFQEWVGQLTSFDFERHMKKYIVRTIYTDIQEQMFGMNWFKTI